MAKLDRKLQKIFGETAGADGKTTFGSIAQTGEAVFSDDVEQLQTEAYSTGWRGAIKEVAGKGKAPILTDLNTINYVSSYQIKYLQQMGVAEWLATETYYLNSLCLYNGLLYKSLQDNNINHLPTETNYWMEYTSKILPVWNEYVNYRLRDKVCYILEGQYLEFRSLKDNNIGNMPPVGIQADTYWARVYPEFTRRYEANITYCLWDEVFYIINGNYCKYISLQNNNLGHTPPDSQSDSWWYRTSAPQTQFSNFTNVIDLGSATSYTAPADGYFFVRWNHFNSVSSIEIMIKVNNVEIFGFNATNNGSYWFINGIYVKKGATITVEAPYVDIFVSSFAYTN